jgi:hypothetical protein
MSYERGLSRKNFSLAPAAIPFSLQPAPWLIAGATLVICVRLLSCCSPILPGGKESSAEIAV